MANVISSFLVGIGFDYDQKGADRIGSGIDSIKSKALQLGAVVAGAFGLKEMTFGFAQSKDMLGKFGEVFGVTANDVQAFGNALSSEGGTLESFMAQLESIERARARIRVGDVAFFAPAGKAGINPNEIADAKSAIDAYRGLADDFARMNQQQRLNAAEALGLDEASIRLLSKGTAEVDAIVAKYKDIRPITSDMTEAAAEFNRQWLEMQQNIGGAADELSEKFLPVINKITKSVNSWFDDTRSPGEKSLSDQPPSEAAARTGLPAWIFMPLPDLFDKITSREFYDKKYRSRDGGGFDFDYGAEQEIDDPDVIKYINMGAPTGSNQYGAPQEIDAPGVMDYINRPPQAGTATNQRIDISLNLDGALLDRRTVNVVNGIAQTTMDDLKSSTVA